MSLSALSVWRNVQRVVSNEIGSDSGFISGLRTVKGQTQMSERQYIARIQDIFKKHGISFSMAPSQQHADFRDVDGLIDIEIKKIGRGYKALFNDTIPKPDVFYIILYCGSKNFAPQILFKKGSDLNDIQPDRQAEFERRMKELLREFKVLSPTITCYPRKNIGVNIKTYLTQN